MPKRPAHDPAVTQLGEPMVIVHREAGELQTLLFNFEGHKPEAYGLIVADIIGHVAKHYDCDPEFVMDWVRKELDNPTTPLTRMGPN